MSPMLVYLVCVLKGIMIILNVLLIYLEIVRQDKFNRCLEKVTNA